MVEGEFDRVVPRERALLTEDDLRAGVVPGLVEAGFAVFCINSRWLGNDSTLIHEIVLLDVAAGLRAVRSRFTSIAALPSLNSVSAPW